MLPYRVGDFNMRISVPRRLWSMIEAFAEQLRQSKLKQDQLEKSLAEVVDWLTKTENRVKEIEAQHRSERDSFFVEMNDELKCQRATLGKPTTDEVTKALCDYLGVVPMKVKEHIELVEVSL